MSRSQELCNNLYPESKPISCIETYFFDIHSKSFIIYITIVPLCKMGRWFFGCPAYQSGPGKDGFRIDVSMASQSSFSRSLPAAS